MPDPNETTGAAPAVVADTNGETEESKRGRGRPTLAELEDRRKALDAREAALAEQELAIAEANMALRERDIEMREKQAAPVAAARSGGIRNETARSSAIREPIRQRRYRGGEMPNEFDIPADQIPEDSSYQWNNYTVFGQSNPHYSAFMGMQGWEPVPTRRHPNLMPPGTHDDAPIIVKGQILVERPIELTQEALQEQLDKARGEVLAKEEQLYGAPKGTLPRARANGSNEFIAINKEIERGQPVKRNYQYDDGGQPIE